MGAGQKAVPAGCRQLGAGSRWVPEDGLPWQGPSQCPSPELQPSLPAPRLAHNAALCGAALRDNGLHNAAFCKEPIC